MYFLFRKKNITIATNWGSVSNLVFEIDFNFSFEKPFVKKVLITNFFTAINNGLQFVHQGEILKVHIKAFLPHNKKGPRTNLYTMTKSIFSP